MTIRAAQAPGTERARDGARRSAEVLKTCADAALRVRCTSQSGIALEASAIFRAPLGIGAGTDLALPLPASSAPEPPSFVH